MRIEYKTQPLDYSPDVTVGYDADTDTLRVTGNCTLPALAELVELVYLDLVATGRIDPTDHV